MPSSIKACDCETDNLSGHLQQHRVQRQQCEGPVYKTGMKFVERRDRNDRLHRRYRW